MLRRAHFADTGIEVLEVLVESIDVKRIYKWTYLLQTYRL